MHIQKDCQEQLELKEGVKNGNSKRSNQLS